MNAHNEQQPATAQEAVAIEVPNGAIFNGNAYADRLETYGFECEAGPLTNCNDWVEFRRCFNHLADWAYSLPPLFAAPVAAAPVDTWFADQLTAMGEVIPMASTPAAPGIDPTDPWRGLYDPARMPKLDGVGDYVAAHPDLPAWPEDDERSIAPLIRAQGFEWDAVSGDYGTDYMSVDEFDTCAWLAAWKPGPPAGEGWRLVLVHDTEDGPAAVFVRPLALIDASPTGGSDWEATDADIAAWQQRHDLAGAFGSKTDARAAFEDARSAESAAGDAEVQP